MPAAAVVGLEHFGVIAVQLQYLFDSMPSLRSADRPLTGPVGAANIISALKNATAQFKGGVTGTVEFALRVATTDADVVLPHWKDLIVALRSSNPENQYWLLSKTKLPPTMLFRFQHALAARNIPH